MKITITENHFQLENASIHDAVTGLAAGFATLFNRFDNAQKKEMLAEMILEATLKAIELGLNSGGVIDEESYDVSMLAEMMKKMKDERED